MKFERSCLALGAVWLIACSDDGAATSPSHQLVLEADGGTVTADGAVVTTPDSGLVAASDGGWSFSATFQSPIDARYVSLCELTSSSPIGSAFYRVESLTAFAEQVQGGENTFTYVQLRKVSDLGRAGAPDAPVARMLGGSTPLGNSGAQAALMVGEVDAIILGAPSDENRGYYNISGLGVFRLVDGGYTNTQLFTSAKATQADITTAFANAAGANGCVQNVFADDDMYTKQDAGSVTCTEPESALIAALSEPSLRACETSDDCTAFPVTFDCSRFATNGIAIRDNDIPMAKRRVGTASNVAAQVEATYCPAWLSLNAAHPCGHVAGFSVLTHVACLAGQCASEPTAATHL